MNFELLSLITIFLYTAITVFSALQVAGKVNLFKWVTVLAGYSAVGLHGLLLYYWIDTPVGQNLAFVNMLSLMMWVIALLIMLTALYRVMEGLIILICPLAALSILLVLLFPSQHLVATGADIKQLTHILLAVLTTSVLCLAALQAILVALQDYQLRHKTGAQGWKKLPPLEVMETFLFQVIVFGFVLLSVIIATSLSFVEVELMPQVMQKVAMVILTWLVFAVLIVGRFFFGWRGRKAIYGTLGGVGLLILAYWSSKLLSLLFHA